MSKKYYYGASYSPLVFPHTCWQADLEKMRSASMNLIRLGDVHGSWDLIEPSPDVNRLDELGEFYRAAAEFDIEILISTGAASPPLWLAREYPDLQIRSNRGELYPLGASYHWACIAHPGYRKALAAYLNTLLDFTSQQPNHFGWQITNEIGFPFLPARGEDTLGLFCYCLNCQEKFKDWVRRKYHTLENLTSSWAWGTTYLAYNDWEEVFPPESPPSAWASVTRWLDWRLFWQEMFANFAGWQHDLIKSRDPNHPTSVNTFNFKGFDRFGTFTGLDQWQIAQQVDHVGYDLYPGSGDKLAARPEHNSIFLDHGRSVAQSTERDFWLHEIESGPIGGWVMGPEYRTDSKDILQYCVEALGHDAKLMLFMPWREWAYQPLHWGALVDLDGNPTPRLDAAAEIGHFVHNNAPLLAQASCPPAEAAVLESKPNAIFFRGVDQEEELFLAQRGAYRALWEVGFSVDFITPKLVQKGLIHRYPQVIMPMMGLIDLETARALADYVHRGGLLIAFARCATLDHLGWFHHQQPIAPFQEVFGIEKVLPDTLSDQKIIFQEQPYPAYWNRDLLHPGPKAQVLARFEDDWPAVTLNAYGDGFALYLATQADTGHLKTQPSILKAVLNEVHAMLGWTPRLQVIEPKTPAREVDPHILDTPVTSLLFINNYLPRDKAVKLVLRDDRKAEALTAVLPEKEHFDWNQKNGELIISYKAGSKEVRIIRIDWMI